MAYTQEELKLPIGPNGLEALQSPGIMNKPLVRAAPEG